MTARRDVVAGVGFRHTATAEEIVELVRLGLVQADLPASRLSALATVEDRADESVFHEAASALGCDALGFPQMALRAVDDRVPTRSARIEAARGVGSVAEASALVGAGPGAILTLQRIASAGATCALALMAKSE